MASLDCSKFSKLVSQRKTKARDIIFKDRYTWWWYSKHTSSDFNSLYMCYKPENYNTIIACYSKFKKGKSNSNNHPTLKMDKKLILSKEIKAVILITSAFIEEQADKIIEGT